MSFEAVLWATSDAPIADVNEFAVLVMMAEKADADGCASFPSRPTLAKRTKIDPRTVLRSLQRMEERKLIGEGDQRAAEYIRADRRPVVYDLLIPADWFPNLARINAERADKGKSPLNRQNRPPIAAPPEKVQRSDKGKKRTAAKPRKAASKRADSRGVSESPRDEGGSDGHGVSLSPVRGVSQSDTGCLEDTQTSPMNHSFEPGRDALAARSAGDGRRPSDRSSVREAEGGVAASSKASPSDHQRDATHRPAGGQKSSSKKAKHTRAQLAQVAAVRAFYPADFLNGLPDIPALSDAILSALATEDRTVQQLGERIEYRWDRHGWASKFYAGEIENPVGAAVAMVRPLKRGDRFACADPRCENGRNIDTGVECRACEERIADRRAERRQEKAQEATGGSNASAVDTLPAMPAQRPAPTVAAPYRECVELTCGRPIARDSDDTLCRQCRQDASDPVLVNSSSNPPF